MNHPKELLNAPRELAIYRRRCLFSMREIAERAEISISYISMIEKGYRPPAWTWQRLANAYGLPVKLFKACIGIGGLSSDDIARLRDATGIPGASFKSATGARGKDSGLRSGVDIESGARTPTKAMEQRSALAGLQVGAKRRRVSKAGE